MKKGFTLIELLIVIGILAILSTTVVLVLNPAQILAKSRDTQRISDLGSIQSALGLVLATVPDPVAAFAFGWGPFVTVAAANKPFATTSPAITRTSRNVNGTGWVSVNMGLAPAGSPLSVLPIDPTNTIIYYYSYIAASGPTYEIDGRLESTDLRGNMATDGGSANTCVTYVEITCYYEVGTSPGLAL